MNQPRVLLLHGLLLGLLLHFDPMRTVFGKAPGDNLEWVWLPEVTLAPPLPAEPPAPAALKEAVRIVITLTLSVDCTVWIALPA